jgi:hypothetical protein
MMQIDEERTRAEDAERKLAALHAAALEGARRIEAHLLRNEYAQQGSARRIMEDVLADSAPAVKSHDRDVRVKELRRVADGVAQTLTGAFIKSWLRDEADRIERGEL